MTTLLYAVMIGVVVGAVGVGLWATVPPVLPWSCMLCRSLGRSSRLQWWTMRKRATGEISPPVHLCPKCVEALKREPSC